VNGVVVFALKFRLGWFGVFTLMVSALKVEEHSLSCLDAPNYIIASQCPVTETGSAVLDGLKAGLQLFFLHSKMLR